MRVSLVTISFNQAKFLEETIRSVLDQAYPDLEYIVVDPGSTDGSREIIERYRDRITRIVYEIDNGAADGLNHGFRYATGDIYGYLNSDDLLLPHALSEVARCFQSDSTVDLVTGHAQIIDADGGWLRASYTDRFNARAFAYQACVICQQSTFFRSELFRRTSGFNVDNRVAWDAELFLDLLQTATGSMLLDKFLSAFRVHREGITGGGMMPLSLEDFEREKFLRITGRHWRGYDNLIRLGYLARKYVLEPRSFWQRLRYGSIYGRFKSTRRRR